MLYFLPLHISQATKSQKVFSTSSHTQNVKSWAAVISQIFVRWDKIWITCRDVKATKIQRLFSFALLTQLKSNVNLNSWEKLLKFEAEGREFAIFWDH